MRVLRYLLILMAGVSILYVGRWILVATLLFSASHDCSQTQRDVAINSAGDTLAIHDTVCEGILFSQMEEVLLRTHASERYKTMLSFEVDGTAAKVGWASDKRASIVVHRPGKIYRYVKRWNGIQIDMLVLTP
jgi:hypothetical protein